jgi:hypothetical protein
MTFMSTLYNRKSADPLFQFAETARALRFAAARDAMNRAWTQLGGARSPLGLSLHRQIKVEGSARDPFEHCAVFRGGVLTLSDDGRHASADAIEEVDLSCLGVEWLGPIERRRPLAGVIAAFGPASGSVDVRCVPERDALRPAGGETRLAAFDLPIVRGGPMQDYWVWVVLIDGDGDGVDAAADVAAIDLVAQRLRGAIVGAAGGASGDLAEALVQRRSFKHSVAGAIADVGSEGRARVSAPICLRLHWSALGARPSAPRPRRESDGATTIAGWTHRIPVPDQGASSGAGEDRCALFFRAETRVEPRWIEVEIPGPGTFRESGRSANE